MHSLSYAFEFHFVNPIPMGLYVYLASPCLLRQLYHNRPYHKQKICPIKSVTNPYRKFSVKGLSENISPRFYWAFLKFALPPSSKPTGNFGSLHIILYVGQTLPIPGMVPMKTKYREDSIWARRR